MLVDSHCHLDRLDLTPFDGDFSECMQRIEEARITRMLCVSVDLESYPAMRRLVDPYSSVSVSVGVHPNESVAQEPEPDQLAALGSDLKVVAIGETGLDDYRCDSRQDWQRERFRTHIRAARAIKKPLIVHSRAAAAETLQILREERAQEVGGVFHCFTENWEVAKQVLDLSFHISFSGILTFKSAKEIQDAGRKVPIDRILIETDAPYLAPVPIRGKPNYPFHLPYVAKFLADLRGLSMESLASATSANFEQLFDLAQA